MITNPDDYIEGTFDSRNPANQKELEIETVTIDLHYLEELERYRNFVKEIVKPFAQGTENTYLLNLIKKL